MCVGVVAARMGNDSLAVPRSDARAGSSCPQLSTRSHQLENIQATGYIMGVGLRHRYYLGSTTGSSLLTCRQYRAAEKVHLYNKKGLLNCTSTVLITVPDRPQRERERVREIKYSNSAITA